MDPMRASNVPEVADAEQPLDREPPVDEAIVHDEVREPEHTHPDPHPERDLARDAGGSPAAVQNERDGDRSMEQRQRVVALEPSVSSTRLVVGAMNRPEPRVPHATVEKRCPEIHGHCEADGRGGPDERVSDLFAHASPAARRA